MSRDYVREDLIAQRRETKSISSGQSYITNGLVYGPSKKLSRSDIIHITRDFAGWRHPSAYEVTDEVSSGFNGTRVLKTRYKNQPGYDTDFTVSGGHDDLPYPSLRANNIPWPPGNDIGRAEVSALLKVRDQKFNAALALAEADKSAALIGNRVTSLYRAYSSFRKGNFKQAAHHLEIKPPRSGKGSANNWLEYQYGWMPLLHDIYGAHEELRRPFRQRNLRIGVKSRVSSEDRVENVSVFNPFKVKSVIRYRFRTQVCLWYEVQNEALLTASATGLVNPLEIAWELTPWSFVVDWMLPVGDVLGALTATSGVTFVSGTRTLTTEANCQDVLEGGVQVIAPGTSYEYSLEGVGTANQSRRTFKMNRSLYFSSPFPSFYYKSPISTGHALNALALFRGLFK